ncbi:GapA-binding peptide SR1P [Paenibacillus thailandensis]|uniref:GapA-binding peptide SR1P n=1 Tax=Paenibacillus thailandensis TaxID=393250 RepID=A0ABW5R308_9BACL
MLHSEVSQHWGVIVCKHCESMVDTFSTNKVVTYYGVCDNPECRDRRRDSEHRTASAEDA